MQDSKGFMWFATDRGACRFDGYEFKTFNTSNGLADNTVFECIEDYKGRIWFRTLSGKLSYFLNDSIYRLPINDSLTKLIKTAFTISMIIDSNDNIYLGLYGFTKGIVKINLKKNTLSVISLTIGLPYLFIGPEHKMLAGYTCQAGYFMGKTVAPDTSISIYALAKGDSSARKVRSWKWSLPTYILIHSRAILLPNGEIAASANTDFIIFDTLKPKFVFFKRFQQEIINLNENSNHDIWLSTQGSPEYYTHSTFINTQLPPFIRSNHVTSVTTDKEGGIWFTSLYGGVYYTGSLNFKIYSTDNGLPGNKITALAVANDGAIWVASQHCNKFSIIHNDSIKYHTLPDIEGLCINNFFFNKNEVWVTNNSVNGLFVFNNNTAFNELAHFEGGCYDLLPDSVNTWVSGYSSLYCLRRENKNIVVVKSKHIETKIFSICNQPDHSIYLGTVKGLLAFKKDSLIEVGDKYPVLKNRVYDIKMAVDGTTWIATKDTGIIIKHDNTLKHITTKDGLLSNFCECLNIDYKGNVWVGTNKGLSHILLKKNGSVNLIDTIINLTSSDLIEINKIVSKGDTVYIGTNNGLIVFNMNKASYNNVPPDIYISALKINNKNWPITTNYDLHYDENYFFINFIGLTYKDAGNTQYRYKMEGIDTGWIYTKNRDVQYPKLAPGKYTFIVSAMNNDGVWNDKPAALHVNIFPPFWATWWFRSLCIAAIAGFIYWRFKVVESRTKKEADINKQLITMELKELKAQMDPHFLFNNLNTLTHLVELKSDDAPEFVEELSKYYRYSLQFRNAEFTELENELKQAIRYIHILKIRFGDNMKIQWNIDETLKSYYVATYSLQLLLENITKHNIVSAAKPIWVEISTTAQNSLLVKNQLQPKNSSALSNGHGLKSINQRYTLLTKRKTIINQTTEYFCVELPLITPDEYESTYS
jgi:ligand-binding sensor domain-containing protein